MSRWSQHHIDKLKSSGFRVKLTSEPQKDRMLEVVSNGKVEKVKFRKALIHEESQLQQNCVRAFDLIYPKLKLRLFSIPNGSYRTAAEASILKAEGCLPGVCDVFLAVPKKNYGGMFIEFKTNAGKLSVYQDQFIKEVSNNYYCVVIKEVEQFLQEVREYLFEL